MTSNPLTTCNPATSWYDFTYPLSWSNECEVAELLSDISFISVGTLMFGVSTLFLVIKRVSLSAIWLYFSALLAFVAVVLDLGRTLLNGTAINTAFTANGVVIRTREVFLAFSIGFRFLFYWSYVAEPPRRDLSAVLIQTVPKTNFPTVEYTDKSHNGSWVRWGLPGKLLGAGLLVAIVIITTLQIVWRMVPAFHQYSNVYATDAALELLVSFLLLLKLLLNTLTLNVPDDMSVYTFRECLAPISGLLVNIAIGVGGLLCFAFTESTVGRLLQSFEVYILVVFVVVTALLKHRDILLSTTSSQGKKCKDVVFTLPEPVRGSTFRITPPLVETPRMSTILGIAIQNNGSSRSEGFRRSARRPLNRVSSWVSSRISRNRARYGDEEVRLWNAETSRVNPPYTGDMDTELRASRVSLTQEPKQYTEHLRDASTRAKHTSIISALDAQSAIVRSMEGSIHSDQTIHPSPADVLQRLIPLQVQTSSIPVSFVPSLISSRVKHVESVRATPVASPVYGLSGAQSRPRTSDSQTSLDELLRQQSQLDQSIEALKLFSARTTANSSHSSSATSLKSVELNRSASIDQRTVSSEVSLSSFPVPPWLTAPVPSLPSSIPSPVKRIRGSGRTRLLAARPTPVQDTYASISPVTSASFVDIPRPPRFNSIPHSPFGEENEPLSAEVKPPRSDSGVTQYNVTSFIGGLATPGEPRQRSRENSLFPIESGPSGVALQTSSGDEKKRRSDIQPIPQRLVGLPASPAAAKFLPVSRSSRLSQGSVVNALANAVRDADPPIAVSTEGADSLRVQKMFIRPRPPPLALQSYTEQNPSLSRVQVLVDD